MCILNPNMSINPVMNAPTCTHVQLKLHCQRDLMTITNHWCSFQYSVSIRSSSFGQLSWHFVTLERLYRFPHLAFFVSFSCVGNCFYWFVEKHEFNQIFLKPPAAPSALSVIVTLFQKFSVVSMGTTLLQTQHQFLPKVPVKWYGPKTELKISKKSKRCPTTNFQRPSKRLEKYY